MDLRGYDDWRLSGPDDDSDAVGTEEGQECGRWSEPDEDCPKSHRCTGDMIDDSGCIICNICGEGE